MTEPEIRRDLRWARLKDREWICPSCSLKHRGLVDLGYASPAYWRGAEKPRANNKIGSSNNILTEDFCILDGEHFFVRCVLQVPVLVEADSHFGFGIWSSLSKTNFDLYVETFDGDDQGDLGPWFGWFSNSLTGYPETLSLKCQVHPRSGRQRPLVELEPSDHPLAIEQREGITLDRLLELYALHGHDMRAALSD